MTAPDGPPDDLPPLNETPPHLREFLAFLPELNKESDRGAALIATSFLDELLRRTLLAFMIEGKASISLIEGFNAPLWPAAAMAIGGDRICDGQRSVVRASWRAVPLRGKGVTSNVSRDPSQSPGSAL